MTTPRQRHARWAAQHASQHLPVRRARAPVAMLAPVATPYLSAAINEGIRAGRTDDEPCACGYLVCCYRGPCAPAAVYTAWDPALPGSERTYELTYVAVSLGGRRFGKSEAMRKHAEATGAIIVAAPTAEEPRFKVGDRVRCTGSRLSLPERFVGREGTFVRDSVGGVLEVDFDGAERDAGWFVHPLDLEPAPAAPAEEWTPLSFGWEPPTPQITTTRYVHKASGAYVFASCDSPGRWWASNGRDYVTTEEDGPKPLAQACAMALGISIERVVGHDEWTAAGLVGDTHRVIVGYDDACTTVEACARLAVERHARGGRS